MKVSRGITVIAGASLLMLGAACAKKKVAVQPPRPASTPTTAATARPPAQAVAQARPAAEPARPAASRFPDAATRARIDELLRRIEDAYFDYDKHTLRSDAVKTLEADARELRTILQDYPDYKLTIEGHCDERGSAEYNVALGDARARAAKQYLVSVGIPDGQLNTISYGKERPQCSTSDEACWQKNRRVHIVAMSKP